MRRCVICASSPAWVSGWRIALASDVPAAGFVATVPDDLEAWLQVYPASVIGLEVLRTDIARMMSFLRTLSRRWPLARVIVVGHWFADQPQLDLLLRAMGAVHVATSVQELPAIVRIIRRYLASSPTFPSDSVLESLRRRLPWTPVP